MRNLESIDQFNQMKNDGKHIFMFSADWCPDCRVIEPILPEIEESFQEFTFVYVDRDEFIDICTEHNVFGIPSFIAFENGKELGRFVSKDRKTKEEITEFLQSVSS